MKLNISTMTELFEILLLEDVIIYVKSPNCGVCDVIYPLIEQISIRHNVQLYTINIDDFPEFKGQYTVFTVPTVLVFSKGKEMIRESKFINHTRIDKYFEKKLN